MESLKDLAFKNIRSDFNDRFVESFLYGFLLEHKADLREKCKKSKNPEKLVYKAATDLMYNLGYPLSEKKKGSYVSRSRNLALDMVDEWYKEYGSAILGASGQTVDYEGCQRLFEMLSKDKSFSKVLIPIIMDARLGIGLYIMGRDNYPRGTFGYSENYYCGLCMMADWQEDKENGLMLVPTTFDYLFYSDRAEEYDSCTIVRDAVLFFENAIIEEFDSCIEKIRDLNGRMPKDCPEGFKVFFSDYRGQKMDDFYINTDEDLEEARIDFMRGMSLE